jgi:hypothetical protein
LPAEGQPREVCLVLLGDLGWGDGAAALGACVGQRGFEDLVDLLRRGRLTMGVGAVLVAGLAAGVGLGRPFAERGGLAFACPAGLLQVGAEASDFGGQRLDLCLLLDESQQFVLRGPGVAHLP